MKGFIIKNADNDQCIILDIHLLEVIFRDENIIFDFFKDIIIDDDNSIFIEGDIYNKARQLESSNNLILSMWDAFKEYENKESRNIEISRIKKIIQPVQNNNSE